MYFRRSSTFIRPIYYLGKKIYQLDISTKLNRNFIVKKSDNLENNFLQYFQQIKEVIWHKRTAGILLSAIPLVSYNDVLYYAKVGDLGNLKRYLKKEDLTKRHDLGWTLFLTAVVNHRMEIAKFLLDYGADVNEREMYSGDREVSRNKRKPLAEVQYSRHHEFSSELGTHVNCHGCTGLHYAVLLNDYKMVEFLLNNDADPTIENSKGYTPIQIANPEIRNLLSSRQDQFMKNKEKREIEERRRFPLEHRLRTTIVGQEAAIDLVSAAIRRKENRWTDEEHPLVFLFLGSSGIGKTETAKQVANYLHKNKKNGFIRIDMSEYQEKHEVAKFIGSPPGYVGHEQGGQLTKALTQCPNAVVLFDEVEKAHPDVLTILLQLFDEGRMTDGQGKTIECKNAIFIMTSNVASEEISLHAQKLREASSDKSKDVEIGRGFKENIMRPILKKHFLRDEFLGRINEMVYFLPFSEAELVRLVKIELEHWAKVAKERHGITLTWDQNLVEYLTDGYNIYYGARSIKYEVDRKVINELALAHERGLFEKGDNIYISLNRDSYSKEETNKKNYEPIEIKILVKDSRGKKKREFMAGSKSRDWVTA